MGMALDKMGCGSGEEEDMECDCDGTEDVPGFATLPRFSRLLAVGNRNSAANGDFDVVISTVVPRDQDGEEDASLSTHQILFDDGLGTETKEGIAFAKERILEGAGLVAAAVQAGRRTLVHCEWGQNRSGSICCAYAVLYQGWAAKDAIAYLRKQNRNERQYEGQHPMCNRVFNKLVRELERERDRRRVSPAPQQGAAGGSGGALPTAVSTAVATAPTPAAQVSIPVACGGNSLMVLKRPAVGQALPASPLQKTIRA